MTTWDEYVKDCAGEVGPTIKIHRFVYVCVPNSRHYKYIKVVEGAQIPADGMLVCGECGNPMLRLRGVD